MINNFKQNIVMGAGILNNI